MLMELKHFILYLQSHSYMLQTKKTMFERGRSEAGNCQERDEQISRAFANAHFFTSLVETLVVYGIGPAIRKIEESQDSRWAEQAIWAHFCHYGGGSLLRNGGGIV